MLALLCGCQHNLPLSNGHQGHLLDAFDNAMFNIPSHPLKDDPDFKPRVVRWTGPIRVRIESDSTPHASQISEIRQALSDLSELTGLDIRQTSSDQKDANFLIRYVKAQDFRLSDGRRASCFTRTWVTQEGVFTRAEIHLPQGNSHTARKCLHHELMHGIGFRGHVFRLQSVLASQISRTRFTNWDKRMLQLLYSPQLRPGMARADSRTALIALLSNPAQVAHLHAP